MDNNEIGTVQEQVSKQANTPVPGSQGDVTHETPAAVPEPTTDTTADTTDTSTGQAVHAAVRSVVMPASGLPGLAVDLWPMDREDREKMAAHVAVLLDLNSDTLKDDTTWNAGQRVNIPNIPE